MADDDPERSPGGSKIFRHEAREREWQAPAESGGMEQIEEHFARFFGKPETVFHELLSDLVHLDVHIIPPAADRDYWTLFTTGMSDRPMAVPQGAENFRFAELLVYLPREWQIGTLSATPPDADADADADKERWYWPIRWLKELARLPHEYETWLGFGHSVPNGDPPQPFSPETKLCGWLLVPPVGVPAEARSIQLEGREVHLYCLHALYAEEMALKLEQGTDALLEAFDQKHIGEVLQLRRPSAVRRKFLGLI